MKFIEPVRFVKMLNHPREAVVAVDEKGMMLCEIKRDGIMEVRAGFFTEALLSAPQLRAIADECYRQNEMLEMREARVGAGKDVRAVPGAGKGRRNRKRSHKAGK